MIAALRGKGHHTVPTAGHCLAGERRGICECDGSQRCQAKYRTQHRPDDLSTYRRRATSIDALTRLAEWVGAVPARNPRSIPVDVNGQPYSLLDDPKSRANLGYLVRP